MFSHNPELKDVFNLAHQRSGATLGTVQCGGGLCQEHRQSGALAGAVERIAHKHTGFLIQPEQYHIVGSHLLATLKEMGGNAVTEEVLTAWGKAYGVLADIFIGRESELYREKASQDGGWQGTRSFIIKEKRQESELITSFVLAPSMATPCCVSNQGNISVSSWFIPPSSIRRSASIPSRTPQWPRLPHQRQARTQGQASNLLHDHLHIGDTLDIMPPAGDFFLQEETDTPVVLISAGVGLTPC